MMPPDNTPAKPAITKDHENQGSDNGKTTRAQEQGIKCPRCDSPNTKFCYYNNYSLTQPRHFCKTCRRYWTNGGALRNVPIGGGCRKNKKVKTSSSSSSSLSRLSCDSKDSASSSAELAGLRFFRGINSPCMEFQLGGLPFPHPPITTGIYNQLSSSFGSASSSATSASSFQLDPSGTSDSFIGLNYPFSSSTASGFIGAIQGMNVNNSLASSIESLSSINQDLHWKLQQQRLAMMCGGDNQKDSSSVSLSPVNNLENQTQKPQPILFQNLEISKPENFQPGGNSRKESPSGDAPSEWFLGNSYSLVTPSTTNSNGANDNDNANNNWSSGVHVWGDVQQPYSILP